MLAYDFFHFLRLLQIRALLADPAAQVKDIAAWYGVSRITLYKRVGVVQPLKQL
ncbi:hypothetical protein [Polaromonas sp. CG_9.11]|uniref:hypothetical protein n=1 Tax=Polaromonas sp. CG_9.11 TaxID=2787730 RepID=UPI0018CBE88B|nr:hypothetical protein [Polaromonas sp. CG_9.11]MBG6077997.1 hypothetical protein [Polaromonas sp. CG_9.11]